MTWLAQLNLDYSLEAERSVARYLHQGPLRILQSLYPEGSELRLTPGATCPHQQIIVLRVLAPVTEPAMQLLRQVWAAWRREMWGMLGTYPRLWQV